MVLQPLTTIVAAGSIDIDATLAIQMVLFLAFFLILNPLLFQPFLKAMEERKKGLQGSREDAEEFEIRAQNALAEYEKKMRDARREAQGIRDTLRNQGQGEQQDIIEEARQEIAVRIEGERQRIEGERDEALESLKKRSDSLADSIVSKILPA